MKLLKIKTIDILLQDKSVQENAQFVACHFFEKDVQVSVECRKCYFYDGIKLNDVACKCPSGLTATETEKLIDHYQNETNKI